MPQPPTSHKTVLITGGTDGIGRSVAETRLSLGDTVIVTGSTAAKGTALAGVAERLGAAGRFRFIQADLSSLAVAVNVIREVSADYQSLDALVLCANRQSPKRQTTPEGLEYCFSLYYLSRYLLTHGLRSLFDAGEAPVIIDVSAPGTKLGSVNFDDLQSERSYSAIRAQAQCARANDLLGVAYGEHPSSKASFILYHPGFTATRGGLEHMAEPARTLVSVLSRVAAKPIDKAAAPIVEWISNSPRRPLTAVDRGKVLDLTQPTFDKTTAERLDSVTRDLVNVKLGPNDLNP